jgi:bacteriorhodopsin
MDNVEFSTNLSIIIQIITGLFSMQGIFIKLPKKHIVLNDILLVESLVQGVELFFYIYFLKSMASTNLQDMASVRYFDWVITTPTMLLTTIVYFKYQEYIEKNVDKTLTFWDFVKENKQNIIIIFVSNFLMLLFGYLGEKNMIDMTTSLLYGFIFFGITFNNIYKNYALKSTSSINIFYFILTVWGLYGVAALLNPYHKNKLFNILDIFAKNFFGLYLYYTAKNISLTNT